MRVVFIALALLQAVPPAPPAERAAPQFSVQLGVSVNPDTVTVGQRFMVRLRIRAPAGATVAFPVAPDSADAPPTATLIVGEPLIQNEPATGATVRTATYRMTAWDTGSQPLFAGNIVVRAGGQVGYVSLADRRVFVKSVLPEKADSLLRVPKPPRDKIVVEPFSEIPWFLFFAALMLAGLGTWLWHVYRRWRNRPLEPFAEAEREFVRIEALNLVAAGEGARHVAMMVDTMRVYLATRIDGIELSQTSSELIAAAGSIQAVTPGLGGLLWRADLAKFAGHAPWGDDSLELGRSAREIVWIVEREIERREAETSRAAAKRAA